MEIVGYSYSFGPITGPRPIDNAKAIRWFHERGITSLEFYDPWMEDEDEVLRIEEAIAATGMRVLMCDVNCHVGFRDADERAAGTARFHERLRVAARLGAGSILILPSMPGWDSDLTGEELPGVAVRGGREEPAGGARARADPAGGQPGVPRETSTEARTG